MLLVPGVLTTVRAAPFIPALKSLSPYPTLVVGMAWAVIGWGLFQLRDFARFVATLLLGAGAAWELSMLVFRTHSSWRILAACLEITLRASAIWYLLRPPILDVFRANHSESSFPRTPLQRQ